MSNEAQTGVPAGPDDQPELHGDFRDMAEQLMAMFRDDDERTALRAQAEDDALAEADRDRAERARSGELGPEWRIVQGRIDLGQTTVEAVFSGEDASLEAEALRQTSRRNLTALRETLAENDDENNAQPAPEEIFEQTLRDSRERFELAARRIEDALKTAARIEEERNHG
jgi:hypothetical protein